QRSQAIAEFAIIAPILVVLLFGIVDFGRGIYIYATLNQAVNEGARTAIRDSAQLPTNAQVETSVRQHAVDVSLANPCPNGPITNAVPPANQGWIYITEPDAGPNVESLSPSLENAPGGQGWSQSNGTCSATNPAHDHTPLQVTIRYNFVPITPLIQQLTANQIVISAAATYQTEY
ncbi:MAG TPA: TadE family protein, partial [Candidatus Dormibacteraeota bacterium]|nr:TadE family protein [Candidatus Dormibacteraeota bacterium]